MNFPGILNSSDNPYDKRPHWKIPSFRSCKLTHSELIKTAFPY